MTSSLGTRLQSARRDRFTGRAPELAAFRAALDSGDAAVFLVWGPGGIGKSSLLDAFAELARERGHRPVAIDARELDASPATFEAAANRFGPGERTILLVDTAELLGNLNGWIRGTFLPGLPADAIVALAGRTPPGREWRADAGWTSLLRMMPLRNFAEEEAESFLAGRGMPAEHRRRAVQVTHGHPLALALYADLADQAPGGETVVPDLPRNLVSELVDLFVEGVPSERHREALYLLAHARVTTEELIGEALGEPGARELFDWLGGLSFVMQAADGLAPHDLARDALDLDLRWRAPEKFRAMHAAVRGWVVRRLHEAGDRMVLPVIFDLLFLHRHNPVMAAFTALQEAGTLYMDLAQSNDRETVLAFARECEGEESAAIVEYWWEHQREGFRIFRDNGGAPVGFCAWIQVIEDAVPVEVDPVHGAALQFIRETRPMRPGEQSWIFRHWVYPAAYQLPSPAMDLIYGWATLIWLTAPSLAWTFVAATKPELWKPLFTYVQCELADERYSRKVGEQTHSLFVHDWRVQPPAEWLDSMGVNELETSAPGTPKPVPAPELVVLSEPDFRKAARAALKDYTDPMALSANLLARSRVAAGADEPGANLAAAVRRAVEGLRANPKSEKLYRVIERTYLEPARTQEAAADELGLPWSTYRRHLTAGVEQVVEALWRAELGD